jgi:hypothetical protein
MVVNARMFWILAVLLIVGVIGPLVARPVVFEILLTVVMVGYVVLVLRSGSTGVVAALVAAFGYGAVLQIGYAGSLVAMMHFANRRAAAKVAGQQMAKLNSKRESTILHD